MENRKKKQCRGFTTNACVFTNLLRGSYRNTASTPWRPPPVTSGTSSTSPHSRHDDWNLSCQACRDRCRWTNYKLVAIFLLHLCKRLPRYFLTWNMLMLTTFNISAATVTQLNGRVKLLPHNAFGTIFITKIFTFPEHKWCKAYSHGYFTRAKWKREISFGWVQVGKYFAIKTQARLVLTELNSQTHRWRMETCLDTRCYHYPCRKWTEHTMLDMTVNRGNKPVGVW